MQPTGIVQLYTREEVARVCSVSLTTVDDWIQKRLLKAFKVGRNVRVEAGEVLAFIARHSSQARVGPAVMGSTNLPGPQDEFWREFDRKIERMIDLKLAKRAEAAA